MWRFTPHTAAVILAAAALADPPVFLRSGLCPENVFAVQVTYRGPQYGFMLMERPAGSAVDEGSELITINGFEGTVDRTQIDDGVRLSVEWTDGKRNFGAIGLFPSAAAENEVLAILESIPE